jgi:hypothetical protein
VKPRASAEFTLSKPAAAKGVRKRERTECLDCARTTGGQQRLHQARARRGIGRNQSERDAAAHLGLVVGRPLRKLLCPRLQQERQHLHVSAPYAIGERSYHVFTRLTRAQVQVYGSAEAEQRTHALHGIIALTLTFAQEAALQLARVYHRTVQLPREVQRRCRSHTHGLLSRGRRCRPRLLPSKGTHALLLGLRSRLLAQLRGFLRVPLLDRAADGNAPVNRDHQLLEVVVAQGAFPHKLDQGGVILPVHGRAKSEDAGVREYVSIGKARHGVRGTTRRVRVAEFAREKRLGLERTAR